MGSLYTVGNPQNSLSIGTSSLITMGGYVDKMISNYDWSQSKFGMVSKVLGFEKFVNNCMPIEFNKNSQLVKLNSQPIQNFNPELINYLLTAVSNFINSFFDTFGVAFDPLTHYFCLTQLDRKVSNTFLIGSLQDGYYTDACDALHFCPDWRPTAEAENNLFGQLQNEANLRYNYSHAQDSNEYQTANKNFWQLRENFINLLNQTTQYEQIFSENMDAENYPFCRVNSNTCRAENDGSGLFTSSFIVALQKNKKNPVPSRVKIDQKSIVKINSTNRSVMYMLGQIGKKTYSSQSIGNIFQNFHNQQLQYEYELLQANYSRILI